MKRTNLVLDPALLEEARRALGLRLQVRSEYVS
jgi:hypothetical protein